MVVHAFLNQTLPLTKDQIKLIENINYKTKVLMANGGSTEDLLVCMHDLMKEFKPVLTSVGQSELDVLCKKYEGFYIFMKVCEELAQDIADGKIRSPSVAVFVICLR